MTASSRRYGVRPPQTGYSYEAIGKALGVSAEGVRFIERQALYKIRILGGEILGDFLEEVGVNLLKKRKTVIENDLNLIAQLIHSRLLYFKEICSNTESRGFKKCGARGIKCNIAPLEFKNFVIKEMNRLKMNTEDYTEFAKAFKSIKIERIDKSKDIVLENLRVRIKG